MKWKLRILICKFRKKSLHGVKQARIVWNRNNDRFYLTIYNLVFLNTLIWHIGKDTFHKKLCRIIGREIISYGMTDRRKYRSTVIVRYIHFFPYNIMPQSDKAVLCITSAPVFHKGKFLCPVNLLLQISADKYTFFCSLFHQILIIAFGLFKYVDQTI